MSLHQAFRRVPVPPQMAQHSTPYIIPAPTRGIIQSENYTFMQPGGALICDNWVPTMRGVKLRGGYIRWCELPETAPIISSFEYKAGNIEKMFAANASKLYDVTSSVPVLIKDTQLSGNYAAAQMANASGNYLIAVNDKGNFPLRFNGAAWTTLSAGEIHGPIGTSVVDGANLVYVWSYRSRLFFIEINSMNAWFLPLNAIEGELKQIPLSGAGKSGGHLIFGATWSMNAGDGMDDKCVFYTSEGEAIVFTGSNPEDAANWRQEGRFQISPAMGMNAHTEIAGDILIATVDGIIPLSQAVNKTPEQLELAAITRNIKPLWRAEVADKSDWAWSMRHWDEYGGFFVATPGGPVGNRHCLLANAQTNAWCRLPGYDATCFMYMRGNFFFGTQNGIVMQADRTGLDDGQPYVATLVGGWEMFQTPPSTVSWRQARATFSSAAGEPFQPQLAACTDYVIRLPTPPPAAQDPGISDVWDQGLWDEALWDQQSALQAPVVRSTGWVSIGETGFSHAPIVQVTIAQQSRPNVEMISIAAIHERLGANV